MSLQQYNELRTKGCDVNFIKMSIIQIAA